MGWNFPHRDHYNYKSTGPFTPYGNQYSRHYPSSAQSASWAQPVRDTSTQPVYDGTNGDGKNGDNGNNVSNNPLINSDSDASLIAVLGDISAVHSALSSTSLPLWLQDLLINSVSHTRDALWWQQCAGCHASKDARVVPATFGYWRQYEAYDCPDLDSIHNDGERHIPYIMFLPDGTR
jgi:non-lysosomal glucosylceramidase